MEKKFPSILPIWRKRLEERKELFTKQRFSFLSVLFSVRILRYSALNVRYIRMYYTLEFVS